jgi:thiol:disulfide interchange protein
MSNKFKAVVLSIVVIAVIAVLFIPQQEQFAEEQSQIPDQGSFTAIPNHEPYQDYLAARRDKKPIVLEFYARW